MAGAVPLRLSLYYAALFGLVGVTLPFWPVWLRGRGLDAGQIGAVLAASLVVKLVTNPLAGHIVDRRGDRRRPMLALAWLSLAAALLYAPATGFWALLAVSCLAQGLFGALFPIGDNLALLKTYAHGLDYGRMRLWGSVAFIVVAMGTGRLLVAADPELILILTLAGLALLVAACWALPEATTRPSDRRSPPARALLTHPLFITFLAAASLLQASHMVYYGFATLHWRDAGLSSDLIGALWAEGVIAEVVLFAFGARLVARLGPARLIALAGLCAALRWTVTALTVEPWLLALSQLLHAATFGATHLGNMHFLARATPPALSARAQSLHASITNGLATGAAMLASGWLYAGLGGGAFLVMAGLGAAGALAAAVLARGWDGGELRLGG